MKPLAVSIVLLSTLGPVAASDTNPNDSAMFQTTPADKTKDASANSIDDYPHPTKPGRSTYYALKTQRGTTTKIPVEDVAKLCGDMDGCSVRIGMHNWDDTGRVASREFLFFYNTRNHVWRASLGDTAGTDTDNVTHHVNQSWSCYFTDGKFEAWADKGDGDPGFGLLSWNQYNADCFLTLID
ncbi:hypothetical protein [Mesorhizobium sp. LNHC252B00]|uniref:hypothetical protein n=1 Tax=Mesorhizobium sp. LNHC252B00 TaxID=1287252 RepID=UPI0012EB1928|nr:hypothetical protein [Mesorhizobium sp. LNHC252B00]